MIELKPFIRAMVSEDEYLKGLGKEFMDLVILGKDKVVYRRYNLSMGRSVLIDTDIPFPAQLVPVGMETTADQRTFLGKTVQPPETEIKTDLLSFFPNGEKLPVILFHQIVEFFRQFMKGNSEVLESLVNHSYEAMAHIVYNPATGYRVAIPTQSVSQATVKYEFDHLEDGDEIIIDIHSHNTMGAFFSGTDNNDDRNKISVSGVVGKLTNESYDTVWRMNLGDVKKELKIGDVFDITQDPVEIPKEWLSRVSVSRPSFVGTGVMGRHTLPPGWDDWRSKQSAYKLPKERSRPLYDFDNPNAREDILWQDPDNAQYFNEDDEEERYWAANRRALNRFGDEQDPFGDARSHGMDLDDDPFAEAGFTRDMFDF